MFLIRFGSFQGGGSEMGEGEEGRRGGDGGNRDLSYVEAVIGSGGNEG